MEFSGTPQEWNAYIAGQPHAQFLQSYEWGVFQKSLGRRVWYLGGGEQKESVRCLAIAYPLKGTMFYLMCPRGPVGVPSDVWSKEFIKWSHEQGAQFARIEPIESVPMKATHVRDVEPSHTRIVDLSKTENELLSVMHPKTRYNIHLSQKKGVIVAAKKYNEITSDELAMWWALSSETAKRNKISVHSREYYQKLLTSFPYITLYQAKWQGSVVAMAVMVGFGDTMYYLYGASTQEHKEVMAPYLLQWQAMVDAKNVGYRYYDFWGVAPDDSSTHPLAGVTRFKKGFGGEVITYPGTFDIPFKKLPYILYTLLRHVKRSL